MKKKGQVGLDVAKGVMYTLMTIAVVAFVVIIVMSSLKDSNVLTAGGDDYNLTQAIFNNVSQGTSSFFANTTTWFALIAIVVIILIIGIVIVAVNRFGSSRGGL